MRTGHTIEKEELELRVAITCQQEEERDRVFGNKCPQVDRSLAFSIIFRSMRDELLETKYDSLITRQFLREERWLEYTLLQMHQLQDREEEIREAVLIEEGVDRATFDMHWNQLENLVVQGTEGTVVHVEEVETRVRYHGVVFDEVSAREQIYALFADERDVVVAKEQRRFQLHRVAMASAVDDEWELRQALLDDQENEFSKIVSLEHKRVRDISLMLLWRIEVDECNARISLEKDIEAELELELEKLKSKEHVDRLAVVEAPRGVLTDQSPAAENEQAVAVVEASQPPVPSAQQEENLDGFDRPDAALYAEFVAQEVAEESHAASHIPLIKAQEVPQKDSSNTVVDVDRRTRFTVEEVDAMWDALDALR